MPSILPRTMPKLKKKAPKQLPQKRTWCFTCYDMSKYEAWKLLDLESLGIRYVIYQKENCPSTKRDHLQCYGEFTGAIRTPQVQKKLGVPGMHCEIRIGTQDDARDYCMKEDNAYFRNNHAKWFLDGEDKGLRIEGTEIVELGTYIKTKGKRNDLHDVADLIREGASENDIWKAYPNTYMRVTRGIRAGLAMQQMDNMNQYAPIVTSVYWGETGAGKNRKIFADEGPANCYLANIVRSGKNNFRLWMDGYIGQPVLVINEFYGQLSTATLQGLLEPYRLRHEVKCAFIVSQWTKIYITSNCHPKDWYNSWNNIPDQVALSIMNRITNIKAFAVKIGTDKQKRHKLSCFGTDRYGMGSILPTTDTSGRYMQGSLFTSLQANKRRCLNNRTFIPSMEQEKPGIFNMFG